MNQNIYLRTRAYFFLIVLLIFPAQFGYSKTNFKIEQSEQSSVENQNRIEIKQAKFKPFKKFRTKEKRGNLFGLLAIVALACSLVSLATLSFTILGGVLSALFFVASCLLAYYGTSKDLLRRLAKLTLIIDLVIALSALLSFWIVTILSL
jgi:hypothetical protein